MSQRTPRLAVVRPFRLPSRWLISARPPSLRRLAGAGLAACVLSACGGGPAPSAGGPASAGGERTVEVTDPAYGVTFSYVTRQFEYVLAPLPGFAQSSAEAQALELVNAERARGGVCPLRDGTWRRYQPAAPLTFEGHLHRAATEYARELAASGRTDLPHRSVLTGQIPAQRMVAAGYRPLPPNGAALLFQESLAVEVGVFSPADIIAAWKASPDHCAALYEPLNVASHGAVARAETQLGGRPAAFWVLNTAG